jgi:hypothetical protein
MDDHDHRTDQADRASPRRNVTAACLFVALVGAVWIVVGAFVGTTCHDDPGWRGSEDIGGFATLSFVTGTLAIVGAVVTALVHPARRRGAGRVVLVIGTALALWIVASVVALGATLSCAGLLD